MQDVKTTETIAEATIFPPNTLSPHIAIYTPINITDIEMTNPNAVTVETKIKKRFT